MDHHPHPSVSVRQLKDRDRHETPRIQPLSRDRLFAIASDRLGIVLKPDTAHPVLQLSPRQPYAKNGNVDVYMPGRWDTSYDLIFMDPLVVRSSGDWDGSVAYVYFKPPSSGFYLLAVHFTGYETTMTLEGPWGKNTAFTAATTDDGVVSATWIGTAGELLPFYVYGTGEILAYIKSIQVYICDLVVADL